MKSCASEQGQSTLPRNAAGQEVRVDITMKVAVPW